ncbi:MAG: spore coat protein U domain-containing protein [Rhizobiales bacterium]|nr:spore coat protein U domain-containing protein [Hyphomicrobiales bacterium]
MRKYLIPLAASAALLSASHAYAAQTSANFQARVNIQTACIVTASNLDFGNVGVIVGTETATSNVAVNCSAGTPFTMSFAAVGPAVTAYTSTMVNGAEDVAYSAALSGGGGTGAVNFTISGTLPSQVTPPAALYTENRVLYVNY